MQHIVTLRYDVSVPLYGDGEVTSLRSFLASTDANSVGEGEIVFVLAAGANPEIASAYSIGRRFE
ncbi:MAG: hypothetical protein FDZ75_08365 [Actinobacteria bacterium]|nr:MAG: hypothetical protein FDZ75_08365 [Actinomycetota bacterium]